MQLADISAHGLGLSPVLNWILLFFFVVFIFSHFSPIKLRKKFEYRHVNSGNKYYHMRA